MIVKYRVLYSDEIDHRRLSVQKWFNASLAIARSRPASILGTESLSTVGMNTSEGLLGGANGRDEPGSVSDVSQPSMNAQIKNVIEPGRLLAAQINLMISNTFFNLASAELNVAESTSNIDQGGTYISSTSPRNLSFPSVQITTKDTAQQAVKNAVISKPAALK